MANTKHTPGEWTVNQLAGSQLDTRIKAGNKIVADCYSFSEDIPGNEAEANAQLIAAAPELLEVLQKTLPNLKYRIKEFKIDGNVWGAEVMQAIVNIHQSAIAKATGKEVSDESK